MTDLKKTFFTDNPIDAHKKLTERVWPYAKSLTVAGHIVKITVDIGVRTITQNDLFHSLCNDLAKSDVKFSGKTRDASDWKVLLVSGHAVATKEPGEVIPGLEGEYVSLRESTAKMSKARGSSLIEYSQAFCALHRVGNELP